MGNIMLLDDNTINKIAAGEVIERPASVIKEMVENSIDAGATNITIEIKNGGISYIKITDNGKGIAQDDIEMAFERHATSKIRSAEDLDTVASMGFRGEALASIAAIAKVEMVSKTKEQSNGYKVVIEGGKMLEKQEVGCQTGTSITVEDLFYNTPVRYKFLKKDYTETGYIEDAVSRIALVNPNVAIKLINSGKVILQTSGNGDLKSVVYSIYGIDIAQGVIPLEYQFEDVKISGVIGNPEIARSNRSNQIFFVNKRYIKDKTVMSATEQAYKGTIEPGKFGFTVLNIEIAQNKVDVNVHPAKLEVRFQEESKIFQAVYHAIKDTIAKNIAQNDQITHVDNIIIQSSNTEVPQIEKIEPQVEKKSGGLFGWKRNKNDFETENNIIEDLYNKKKNDDENVVNTSDVLQELRQIRNHQEQDLKELKTVEELPKSILNMKDESAEEQEKTVENEELANLHNKIKEEMKNRLHPEKSDLPDGSTYTYFGENKEKIESLLRQLHPEKNKNLAENEEKQESESRQENEEMQESESRQENEEMQESESRQENEEMQESKSKQENEIVQEENKNEDMVQNIIEMPLNEQQENIINNKEKAENVVEKQFIEPQEKITHNDTEEEKNIENKTQDENEKDSANNSNTSEFNKMYEKLFGKTIEKPNQEVEIDINAIDIIKDNISVFEGIDKYQRPTYKIVGMVFEKYIIIEMAKEMYIINQKSAKEKIVYEKLIRNYYRPIEKDSQMLLLPDIIELTQGQTEIVKENLELLAKAGFSIEEFGENTIKLVGVPTVCLELDTKNVFVEVLEEINTVARTAIKEKEEKIMAKIAEKIVVQDSGIQTLQEVEALLDELLSLSEPFAYIYNKPIAIKMTKYDIERKFSRK